MSNSQSTAVFKLSFLKNGNLWQTILLILIAIFIWQIYYPGIMSPDSFDQYGQALKGDFDDWHPPLLAIVLWVVLKLGGGISSLIFFQSLLALLGLRSAITFSILFYSNQGISKQSSRAIATFVTILFLMPFLTPFMFISVIFLKDAWLSIMLLWIISYLLWVYLYLELLSNRALILHILALSLTSALTILLRHNAVLILPVICTMLVVLSLNKFGKTGLIAAGLPLFLILILNPVLHSVFNIKHVRAGNLIVARDLTTMLQLYPELEAEYPETVRHQNTPKIGPKALIVELGGNNTELQNEYTKTMIKHPSAFLYTRFYLFGQMLGPSSWYQQKIAYDIIGNEYGLKTNENFNVIRYKLNELSLYTANSWYFIWISGLHILWLALNILSAMFFSTRLFIKRDRKSLFLLLLCLIPFSYYFSYVLAATTSDYRFMYPSTLIMQVLVASLLSSKIYKFFLKTTNQPCVRL